MQQDKQFHYPHAKIKLISGPLMGLERTKQEKPKEPNCTTLNQHFELPLISSQNLPEQRTGKEFWQEKTK